MEKTPMGLIIKAIMQEKNLSPTKVAGQLGISKQQVYNTYNRINFHKGEVSKWAEVLGVTPKDLTDYSFGSIIPSTSSSFGEDVLETIKRLLEEELREKNEQIRALQETLKQSQRALEQAQDLSSRLLGKWREYRDGKVITNWLRSGEVENDAPAQIA